MAAKKSTPKQKSPVKTAPKRGAAKKRASKGKSVKDEAEELMTEIEQVIDEQVAAYRREVVKRLQFILKLGGKYPGSINDLLKLL
jgi:hypothetical protein